MISKACRKFFSTSTKPHVWVNKHTKVICQGITGKQVIISPIFLIFSGYLPN